MIPDWRPFKVTASGSRGTATDLGCAEGTEDTITLLVDWVKNDDPSKIGTAVYTASWTAPQKAGVHSNQYFHCKPANLTPGICACTIKLTMNVERYGESG